MSELPGKAQDPTIERRIGIMDQEAHDQDDLNNADGNSTDHDGRFQSFYNHGPTPETGNSHGHDANGQEERFKVFFDLPDSKGKDQQGRGEPGQSYDRGKDRLERDVRHEIDRGSMAQKLINIPNAAF